MEDLGVGHALTAQHHPTAPEQLSRAAGWQQEVPSVSQGQGWSQTHLQGPRHEPRWA